MTKRTRIKFQGSTDPIATTTRYITTGNPDRTLFVGESGNETSTISDVVTPGFHKKIAEGQIINNPMIKKKTEHSPSKGKSVFVSGAGNMEITEGALYEWAMHHWGAVVTWEGGSVSSHPDRMSETKATALTNINRSEFAFGEDAFEVQETYKFLATTVNAVKNPAKALYRISKRIRRLARMRMRKAYRTGDTTLTMTDALASAYLQYRFAVTPLIQSMMNIVEAYEAPKKIYSQRLNARAKNTSSLHFTRTGKTASGLVIEQETSSLQTERASIMYEIKNPVYDWRHTLGFRAKDLPATLWAVMPLSFMVDRFLDVSSFIKGCTNLVDPSIRILSGSSSVTTETTSSKIAVSRAYTGGSSRTFEHTEPAVDTIVSTRRDVWVPSFFDTIPVIDPSGLISDSTNVADLMSLIYVNLRP